MRNHWKSHSTIILTWEINILFTASLIMLFLLSFARCEVVRVHVVIIQCALYADTVYRVIPPDFPTSPDPPQASYQIAASRSPSKRQTTSHWKPTRRRVLRQSCLPRFSDRAWPPQVSELLPDRRYACIRKNPSLGVTIQARQAPAAAPAAGSRSRPTAERSLQPSMSPTSMRPTHERLSTDMSSRRCFEPSFPTLRMRTTWVSMR